MRLILNYSKNLFEYIQISKLLFLKGQMHGLGETQILSIWQLSLRSSIVTICFKDFESNK